MAKTAKFDAPSVEFGLICDEGSSPAAIHGLTDLFRYGGEMAAKRMDAVPRITHWRANDANGQISCVYDSRPGTAQAPSVLIVPGNEQAPHATSLGGPIVDWLRRNHSQGVVLAAVCGGVFVLARTGLLNGRQATTHWAFHNHFAAQFPQVLTETDRMVIDYGDVMTAGGILAWTDLGLRLIERFMGPTVMLETARYMLVDPPGREQKYYSDFDPKNKHGDTAILQAQDWLVARRERSVSIADAARHACLEPRTFLRRFVKATGMTPREYQQRLRITRAREMLEFSRSSVDEIASRVGYDDVGGFRRVFRKIMGLTPSDYRRRFGRLAQ